MAELSVLIKPTCGNCAHRDNDGDCLALLGVDVPMWADDYLQTHIEPTDADQCADECDAWEYETAPELRHG